MEGNSWTDGEVTIQVETMLNGGRPTTGLVWALGDVRKRELDLVQPLSSDFSSGLAYEVGS